MMTVIRAGGMLSGEHGIGLEKLEFMSHVYTEEDMDGMRKVRAVFDPQNLANPNKAVPSRRCWEVKGHEPPKLAFATKKSNA